MVLFRIAAMWATPLEAPPGTIPLLDPLVRLFGPGKLLTKDLFFSGHTSTLFLLALTVPGRGWKALFLVCTAAVGISVLVQHVHYTVDVLAAPFFAYASARLAARPRPLTGLRRSTRAARSAGPSAPRGPGVSGRGACPRAP